ncbi:hypothetical protein [Nonomuraea sp. LPB2021202275-12-8]|uniref:hypothetical protein n=1 Tax=Nonomuraea sp. LPB2021202275-12-8 TaxID=3120159 RepID=UPI00300C1540
MADGTRGDLVVDMSVSTDGYVIAPGTALSGGRGHRCSRTATAMSLTYRVRGR